MNKGQKSVNLRRWCEHFMFEMLIIKYMYKEFQDLLNGPFARWPYKRTHIFFLFMTVTMLIVNIVPGHKWLFFTYLHTLYWRTKLKNSGNTPILSEDMPLYKLLYFNSFVLFISAFLLWIEWIHSLLIIYIYYDLLWLIFVLCLTRKS